MTRSSGGPADGPFARVAPPRRPRVRADLVVAVFAGGCVGGLVRYAATRQWPTPSYGFPWATFTVNVAGAFVLALLVVVVTDVLGPSRYLRPVIGTGFCGALTTFSSLVVDVDRLVAHHQVGLGLAYLAGSVAAGLAAAALGVAVGRGFEVYRRTTSRTGAD